MRQMYALSTDRHGLRGHFTSLKPIRPQNAPDPWEAEILKSFKNDANEVSSLAVLDGEEYMRVMRPMMMVERCLKCHAEQDYKVGDVRGGVSVSVPMAPYWSQARSQMTPLFLGHGFIWVLGLVGLGVGVRNVQGRVAEREKAEEQLAAERNKLESIVGGIGAGLTLLDGETRVTWANDIVQRWFGPLDDIQGRFCYELYDLQNPETECAALRCLRSGQLEKGESFVHTVGGQERCFQLITAPVTNPEGRITQLVELTIDITERIRSEEERLKLEAQVQHAQKLESLGVLAGGIAHDFNNLLLAILGNADLALLDMSPVSPVRQNVEEIKKASQRAAELAKQMLAYSGKGRFVVEAIDLSEVIEEMSHMLQVSTSKKAVLKYNFARNLPAVEADATQIRQIVMNLITNASEAIGDRSGIISVSTGLMHVDRRYLRDTYLDEDLPDGLYVTLEVADTGCGMDAATQAKMFDPFFTTKFTGRGLGMAAVLGIVRGHGGAIKVYSEVGKGTTIKVLLPTSEAERAAATGGAESDRGWQGSGTVLLADDEESVLAIGRMMLERLGMTVVTAAHGREAVDVFRQREGDIDCVILDLTMPHMDGEETFRELRRLQPDVRVIMSSGYNEQEVTQRFVGKGVAGFIQKPYELSELQRVLQAALEG
jgi:signal transduction histidine kinase/CheY-like chemotaxis protein